MQQADVRIVVGEGDSARQGLIRFVLEHEGFEVAGEGRTVGELARLLAAERPHVVVLDDGIGATAVQMARQIVPGAKLILVWPDAVVPIGGDARVAPADVLRELGQTVRRVAGVTAVELTQTFDRPDWIDKVRKDPATLRAILERNGGLAAKRPSVTELQRRGRRLHPAARLGLSSKKDAASLVILPTVFGGSTEGGTSTQSSGGKAGSEHGTATPTDPQAGGQLSDDDASELNRKLGMIALGGAAVAGAIMLALSFTAPRSGVISADAVSTSRITPEIVLGDGGGTGPFTDADDDGNGGGGSEPGGSGGGTQGGSNGGTTDVGPTTGGTDGGTDIGGTGGGSTGGATTDGTTGGGQGGTTDGGGTQTPAPQFPGTSAEHNPHGGPPGQTREPGQAATEAHADVALRSGSEHAAAHANVHHHHKT